MSNFATLNQNPKVDMELIGTVKDVEETKYTEKGKPFNKVNLIDNTGQSRWVKIFQGNNPPMSPAQKGQRLAFKLKGDVYQGKQYYQGFWQCPKPQEEPDYGQDAAYGVPQAPQVKNSALPAPNYPPQQNRNPQDDRNDCICRQTAGKCAAEAITCVNMSDATPEYVLGYLMQIAVPLAEYFITGKMSMLSVEEPRSSREPGEDDEGPDPTF